MAVASALVKLVALAVEIGVQDLTQTGAESAVEAAEWAVAIESVVASATTAQAFAAALAEQPAVAATGLDRCTDRQPLRRTAFRYEAE